MTAVPDSAPAASVQAMHLPLRQDDPVSLMLLIKILLVTAILLALAYVVLRWYARRQGPGAAPAARSELQCTSVVRLSARTRVYRIRADAVDVLITESPSGATVTVLPGTSSSAQPESR